MSDSDTHNPPTRVSGRPALPPSLQAVKSDLSQAIRRNHARRMRRRRVMRLSAIGIGSALVLSASALGAGSVFGVIDLNGGFTATRVTVIPVLGHGPSPENSTNGFTTSTSKAPDVYHLIGGESAHLRCGPTDPHPVNNIYIEATRTLSAGELQEILADETGHPTSESAKHDGLQIIPNEDTAYPDAYRNVPIKPGRKSEPSVPLREFPGVIRTNNICPTPGVAGQSGSPSSPIQPGEAAVKISPEDILAPAPDEGANTSPTLTAAEEASVIAASEPDQSPTGPEDHLLVGAATTQALPAQPQTPSAAPEGQTSTSANPAKQDSESRERTCNKPGTELKSLTVRNGTVYEFLIECKPGPNGTLTTETTPAVPDPEYGHEQANAE